jgi:hypothetical protein
MKDDNHSGQTYDEIMGGAAAHIMLKIQTKNPIELGDFVSEFTSVASQYEKFIRENHPDLGAEARIFVKQIKKGSIIAELLPFTPLAILGVQEIVSSIEQINAVTEFVKNYGNKLKTYFKKHGEVKDASRSDLKDFMGSLAVIANDPNGSASLEAAVFEDGKKKIKAAVQFTTRDAVRAVQHIEEHRKKLERKDTADFQRVLMVFRQANVRDSAVGKRTGEWVLIEEISDRELPLIYASDLAEQRIKHEIREADDNLFKKGFVVDVNVQTKGGRPVAYRVTNLHQVIDLPDDDA